MRCNIASAAALLKAIEKEMLASPDQQISPTDPDSRLMATSGRRLGRRWLQRSGRVNTEHYLIVTHEVTQPGNLRWPCMRSPTMSCA
jgi:hypothetical protein